MSDRESCVERGHAVLVSLAHRFPQLYVAPGDDAGEAHRLARLRGVVPPNANLDHFHGSADDELRVVSTPAGPVEVVFLKEGRVLLHENADALREREGKSVDHVFREVFAC